MKSKISFILVLKSKTFEVPFQFKNISDVNPDIFEKLISDPKHEYYVKSEVNEEIFQKFIDFWVQGAEPEIKIENYYQYSLLSQEFSLMNNYLASSMRNWSEYEQNIYILNDPSITDKSIIEQKVAQNLDDYIENQGEHLMRLNIQTLYNIFRNKNKKFTKHDRAYELIHQRFYENQDSNIFILLNFIEGHKIKFSHLNESILNSEQKFGFQPKFDLSIFDEIKSIKEQNQRQEEIIQGLNQNYKKQKQENQNLLNKIEQMNSLFSNYKENQEKENKKLRILIQDLNLQNDKFQDELKKQKELYVNQQKSIENKIAKNEQISNEISIQIDEVKKFNKVESEKNEKTQKTSISNEKLINEQNKKINELEQSISKMKTEIENLLKEKNDSNLKSKQLPAKKNEQDLIICSNGFFKYLFDKYKTNPINKGLIEITGNCNDYNKIDYLPNIIDLNWSDYYNSKDEPNSYIKIDFKKFLVKFNKYKLDIGDANCDQLFKSWLLKGFTKENEEIILDEVNDSNEVTEKNTKINRSIKLQNIPFVGSIILQMKGKNSKNSHYFCLKHIEFFGTFVCLS